ncbi:hypothetical protein BBO99_00007083 [Phytophthora kernoviae]|uniref:Transmembrane protein 50A n=1 Tax=Phytophthora kernoviae TaxID=325452 RepID=A0A3R7IIR9_9STRA|nr:hypothetical protein BBI17_007056 [Phytophthora kernoviae]RLN77014.1 hypothetical protein BBO99_00007083 [Phytophthora kernoviae]
MGVDPSKAGSYVAGLLVGVGWWVLADGAATAAFHNSQIRFDFVKYLPGIISTLVFFLVNTVDWGMLSEDARFAYGEDVATRARCFVVFCMALSVAALVGSVLVFTHTYVNNPYNESAWPGAAIVFQNGFILIGTFVMRVGTIAAASTY